MLRNFKHKRNVAVYDKILTIKYGRHSIVSVLRITNKYFQSCVWSICIFKCCVRFQTFQYIYDSIAHVQGFKNKRIANIIAYEHHLLKCVFNSVLHFISKLSSLYLLHWDINRFMYGDTQITGRINSLFMINCVSANSVLFCVSYLN